MTQTCALSFLNSQQKIDSFDVSLHQIRQITSSGIESHNSPEGIHQDGADYIISACVLNRYNIQGGTSYIYDNNLDYLYTALLKENEFIFQDDKSLYHYITPIQYSNIHSDDPFGHRDIIGLDITIL